MLVGPDDDSGVVSVVPVLDVELVPESVTSKSQPPLFF
jgi:hypothetical protein